VSEIVNSVIGRAPARPDGLEARIFRSMLLAVAIATAISGVVGPWRVTTGLLLGGLLSLVNYRWLHGSVAALLNVQHPGTRPRPRIWKHAFRYIVIAGAVFAAYKLQIVSLPATIVGLCSFVVALFVEASRQFYFAIIRREESF
jgi:hypothetical protein